MNCGKQVEPRGKPQQPTGRAGSSMQSCKDTLWVHKMEQAVIACMQRLDNQLQSQPSLQPCEIHSPGPILQPVSSPPFSPRGHTPSPVLKTLEEKVFKAGKEYSVQW